MNITINNKNNRINFEKMKASSVSKTISQALKDVKPYDVPYEVLTGKKKVEITIEKQDVPHISAEILY